MNESSSLTEKILGCAFEVHSQLGPGLLESVYEECLYYELTESGIFVERQKGIPVFYKGIKMNLGFRVDLMVERQIILELKSVETLTNVHLAQIISYLKLADCKIGFLLNFNEKSLRYGIKRVVNNY